jgi:hypothetical protein
MRIFLSCQQSLQRHPVPTYGFWETYFKQGLEESGHDWTEALGIDWAEGLVYFDPEPLTQWRTRTWNRVVDQIQQQHRSQVIDLFLSYLFPKQVDPDAIQEIQSMGIPCVNFFCDNVRELTKLPSEFCCFDLHWVPEVKALTLYQKAHQSYVYAPMPVWIPPAQRQWQHSENYGVCFIGSRDIQRERLLARVIQAGIPLEIRGAAWVRTTTTDSGSPPSRSRAWQQRLANQWGFMRQQGGTAWMRKLWSKHYARVPDQVFVMAVRPQPTDAEYALILQQSQITLGINRYPSFRHPLHRPDTYSRMRDIEAPMMGACYLTEWTEGLSDLYDLGEEIETYRDADELGAKIQWLLADPPKRQTLRRQGQQRALTDHSIGKSLEKIKSALGLEMPRLTLARERG